MKSVVVLSGKGGVGKSSITSSLAVTFSKNNKIVCADCDVDASNLALLFGFETERYNEWNPVSTNMKAVIDTKKCVGCGRCYDACYFGAIKKNSSKQFYGVEEFGCEGCGACELVCPVDAIKLEKINNAFIGYAKTKYGFDIASAQLLPGNSGSGKVVSEVKKKANHITKDADIMIIDSAAGIGCPVIASVAGSDYALIVTEPTPSGFYDMKKAIDIVDHFNMKKGIIINKSDINLEYTKNIENYLRDNNIKLVKKINFDKNFVHSMSEMKPVLEYDIKYEEIFEDIANNIKKEI